MQTTIPNSGSKYKKRLFFFFFIIVLIFSILIGGFQYKEENCTAVKNLSMPSIFTHNRYMS